MAAPAPPPPPNIPPVISDGYPTDWNGNRINDNLESGGQQGLQIAQEEMTKVELVFNAPVIQRQIDEFLRLGGEITYLFRAVSYGWNGRIPSRNVVRLPAAMGPTLVQVEPVHQLTRYMDRASQVGRVRPIWAPGFAGNGSGFSGNSRTTIAFIGDGVDSKHADLGGRCVYWKDFTDDAEPAPCDFDGHDSLAAGIAVGTGQAGGADAGELHFTYTGPWPDYFHLAYPIWLPSGTATMKSEATWTGGTATLLHCSWAKGTSGDNMQILGSFAEGLSPQTLDNTFSTARQNVIAVSLADFDSERDLDNVVIATSVSPYPGVGDGFNRFRGVAPGCKWAAVKVYDRDGWAETDHFTAALDDLVSQRVNKNIKILNVSHGLTGFLGLPEESASLRDKVNTVVNNGIVVVAAAGNGAEASSEMLRKMADPARAAMAITVGATNDENALAGYSAYGFFSPRTSAGEDFKPDVVAPGGSFYHTAMMSVDSGSSDGYTMDKEADDYANLYGTSFSTPYVSGCAALLVEALEKKGTNWSFQSAKHPRYIKMLLCATASETNAKRETAQQDPTLDRAEGGPQAFPPGKDPYEGYGLINPDAAVEAVTLTHAGGSTESITLGGDATAKRVWARTVNLKAGCDLDVVMSNPDGADADLYLYSTTPSSTGTPAILACSTSPDAGGEESLHYAPAGNAAALLVVKRISGEGTFVLHSTQAGPPTAQDLSVTGGINAPLTITLKAGDDGRPTPPGAISYTIVSKPKKGKLQFHNTGATINAVPAKLPNFSDKVTYVPNTNWIGADSFTFYAHDGGTAPFGGRSNTATVKITVVREVTVEYQVAASADDVFAMKESWYQRLDDSAMAIGNYTVGMRFQNIAIPPGAQIKTATLKICSYTNLLKYSVDCAIGAEAADNPPDFSGNTRALSSLSTTGASTTWDLRASAPWTPNTWYDSPDVGVVIQEIVNRPGWSAGNALAVIFKGNSFDGGERRFWSYDGDSSKAARLIITYQPK